MRDIARLDDYRHTPTPAAVPAPATEREQGVESPSALPGSARPAATEPLWRDLLGEELRDRRHRRTETLSRTAERAGISPQYLSEMERGLKEPSSEMIAAVAGALGTSLLELVGDVARRLASTRGPDVGGPQLLAA
jgi:DNA-binding XRE family transcriptional regulator